MGFDNENKKGKHSRPACYIVDENPVRGHDEKRKGLRKEVGPVGVRKVLLAEKAVEGQKLVFEFILVCRRRVILQEFCFYSQASIQVS